MITFASVPNVPGPVFNIFITDTPWTGYGKTLPFPMPEQTSEEWFEAPTGTLEGYIYDGSNFSPPSGPTLDEAKAIQSTILSQDCATTIVSGYPSEALGSFYTYPSKPTDEMNMAASVIASLLPDLPQDWITPFWCESNTGVWAMVNHTATQIQQVGRDAKTFVQAQQLKLAALIVQVNEAQTVNAVEAITW